MRHILIFDQAQRQEPKKRIRKAKVEKPKPESLRIQYPQEWTYEQRCDADERRILEIQVSE